MSAVYILLDAMSLKLNEKYEHLNLVVIPSFKKSTWES